MHAAILSGENVSDQQQSHHPHEPKEHETGTAKQKNDIRQQNTDMV
jgi:hypothetical protein